MKFKFLIIAFSVLIVVIILFMTLIPMVLSSVGAVLNFRHIILPLIFFMVFLLAGMGAFFFYNYRLLFLLEREDWPALAYYLEQKIYTKGNYSNRNVRLLASSYLVISDYSSVLKLESKTMLVKPVLVDRNLLLFGSARVLNGNYAEAAAFFKLHIDSGKLNINNDNWARLFFGFSLLLSGAFKLAQPEFESLAVSSKNTLIIGLASYFLVNSVSRHSDNSAECLAAAESGRIRVTNKVIKHSGWKREVDKAGSDIHIAIIKKYVNETGQWLFPG